MKVAVIGCGYWGKNLVRNFYELGALKGVSDPHPTTAQTIAQNYDVSVMSYEEIESDPEISGVVIAAPAILHASISERFLKAGKHVFVEKPLALTMSDAKSMIQTAHQKQKILMVGHLLQYHSAYLKLKEMVKKGDIGDIRHIFSDRMSFGKIRTEENVLWSFAPHDFSMVLGLIDEMPSYIQTTGMSYISDGIPDICSTTMTFPAGQQSTISVSWLHHEKKQSLTVVGSKGVLVFDDTKDWENKLILYPQATIIENGVPVLRREDAQKVQLNIAEPLKAECQHFIDCIKNNTKPRTDGHEGERILRALTAAQKSLDTKERVDFSDKNYYTHETSFVDEGALVGSGTKIWHFSHILKGTTVGTECTIGQNVMIGPDVIVGNKCKIQNNVSIYNGVTLEDGVFCGPSCVFTNVNNPRAEIERKDEYRRTYVEKGVTIGANSTIVCGVRLGAYSFVGAGAVVTKDVAPNALVVGNPARQIGWMSHAGEKLSESLVCPRTGDTYKIVDKHLVKKEI